MCIDIGSEETLGRVNIDHDKVKQKMELPGRSKVDDHPICVAAFENDLEALISLLKDGADPNTIDMDRDEMTLLMHAAANGNIYIMELLISKGADIDVMSQFGMTALSYAIMYEQLACCHRLLKLGADPNIPISYNGPLMIAIPRQKSDNFVKLLLEFGANTGVPGFLHSIVESGKHSLLELLLSQTTLDVNKKCSKSLYADLGSTPLHVSAKLGNMQCVDILLKAGAQVDAKDNCGQTALHVATAYGHVKTVRQLIDSGSDVNSKDNTFSSLTPCHIAAQLGHVSCLRMLIESGANPNATDRDGVTPLLRAICAKQQTTSTILLREHCNYNTPIRCLMNVQKQDPAFTALDIAIKHNMTDILCLLVATGCCLTGLQQYRSNDRRGDNSTQRVGGSPQWLYDLSKQPRSLLDLSRVSIRNRLGSVISGKVTELTLPTRLQDMLMLKDVIVQCEKDVIKTADKCSSSNRSIPYYMSAQLHVNNVCK